MSVIEVKPDIYWIGVNDRTTDLFEGMWPIANEGVSYNAYLIRDEKNTIIDLAKAFKTDEFFDQISEIIEPSQLDYVVINHMEPDHSGIIRMLRKVAPDVTILCSDKTVEMLNNYYGIPGCSGWRNDLAGEEDATIFLRPVCALAGDHGYL